MLLEKLEKVNVVFTIIYFKNLNKQGQIVEKIILMDWLWKNKRKERHVYIENMS